MGRLADKIKENGIAVSDYYAMREAYFDLTPAGNTLIRTLDPLIARYVGGTVLDAGAGRLTYVPRLQRYAGRVVSLDRGRVRKGLSTVGDLEALPFGSSTFDSVFCSQVLEHVPNPHEVLCEFRRILVPNGHLVLSVPHLAYLHNEPDDYYRYTEYGIGFLAESAGFEIIEKRWSGGLLSFLGHLPSTLTINLTWGIPVVFPCVFFVNKVWSRAIGRIESKDTVQKRFALNIVLVCRKTENRNA